LLSESNHWILHKPPRIKFILKLYENYWHLGTSINRSLYIACSSWSIFHSACGSILILVWLSWWTLVQGASCSGNRASSFTNGTFEQFCCQTCRCLGNKGKLAERSRQRYIAPMFWSQHWKICRRAPTTEK